ncbi:Nramp family divalent metal transporter [Oecophyllibacter saccharovorans]|uniref:Divalent metal cation transporter MntH n=1 Tax=Oecophyllibacter saccharovorans TaxID=2558360 RepID=A0A506UKR1_9PROT|nr:Nramp family divalent metal transporter [Oecophyllibacter saccharovorans]TPW33937.1 divalent metal cation transporter [Oecophyllibacter saccharovorans]
MAEGRLAAVPLVGLAPTGASAFRRFLAFVGPGYMVAVGYMDPGNWATDLEGGARYGYTLLSVILISNLMAVLLQSLSARLGIATGQDLAQACRLWLPPWLNGFLWFTCEIAIIACDLAEVIGTAVALQLLFGFPLLLGAFLSVGDVFLALLLMRWGFRLLEAFVMALLGIIALCFGIEVVMAHPALKALLHGFIPSPHILTDPGMLYLAIGIIGATVMPHNLYLHSALVKTRAYPRTLEGRREALRWAQLDSGFALTLALGVNAAILIVAAAAFHGTKYQNVAELSDAWKLLTPVLGFGMASTLFAVALLAAGTNSTVTGTLAGQIVMEGFLHISLPPWLRRLLTRGVAVLPVLLIIGLWGEGHVGSLLIFSQVVLSLQLPFAVIPLVVFTSSRRKMGPFALSPFWVAMAWLVALTLVGLNGKLLYDALKGLL